MSERLATSEEIMKELDHATRAVVEAQDELARAVGYASRMRKALDLALMRETLKGN